MAQIQSPQPGAQRFSSTPLTRRALSTRDPVRRVARRVKAYSLASAGYTGMGDQEKEPNAILVLTDRETARHVSRRLGGTRAWTF